MALQVNALDGAGIFRLRRRRQRRLDAQEQHRHCGEPEQRTGYFGFIHRQTPYTGRPTPARRAIVSLNEGICAFVAPPRVAIWAERASRRFSGSTELRPAAASEVQ